MMMTMMIIIIIVNIGFSMKVNLFLITDLEPTHGTQTMPSLNRDNSHKNWEAQVF